MSGDKFAHSHEYVNKVISMFFSPEKFPPWIRREKFLNHLRTVLFTELYENAYIKDWKKFLLPFTGEIFHMDAQLVPMEIVISLRPSEELHEEMELLRKKKLEKLLPEFLSTFEAV